MKTLFIGLNWLGDVIISFPALHAAHQAGHQISILTRTNLAQVYSLFPAPARLYHLLTDLAWWQQLPLLKTIRSQHFDQIIVLPRSWRTAFLSFLCGGKERIGYPGDGRSIWLSRVPPLPDGWTSLHERDLYQHLISTMGSFPPEGKLPLPRPLVPDEVTRILEKFHIPLNVPYAVLAPGAAFGTGKRWPLDRFQELAGRIVQKYQWNIIATGSASEKILTRTISGSLGNKGFDLGGKTSLAELATILQNARFLVANDSGTMHLGSFLRTPLVVPIGPTDPVRTGPLSPGVRLVKASTDHPPCRRRECPRGDHQCMNSISVERIICALADLLQESHQPQ